MMRSETAKQDFLQNNTWNDGFSYNNHKLWYIIHVYPNLFVYLRPSFEWSGVLKLQHKGIQDPHDDKNLNCTSSSQTLTKQVRTQVLQN